MRNQSQLHLLRRTSLWLLGQALPPTDALKKPARMALTGVVVAAAAGTLIALSVVAFLIGFYMYLVGEGFSAGASLSVVSALGFVAGVLVFLIARNRFNSVPEQLEDLQLFQGQSSDFIGELVKMVVGGFIEGASDKVASMNKKADRSREELEAQIEKLMDRLDEITADAQDKAEEVVLDIEKHAPRKSRRKP